MLIIVPGLIVSCTGQTKNANTATASSTASGNIVGGGCDGCELMYVDMPTHIKSVDTSSAWFGPGQRLIATGIVFKLDGKTVAPGVIIYYWQTNQEGYYAPASTQSVQAKIHGQIRGWAKTDEQGRYTIYTIRPGPYPGLGSPAHIHFSIKEPHLADEYYIDDIVFEDDTLVNKSYRTSMPNRAGNGITKIKMKDAVQIAERNITLGLNIPHYPAK